MEDWKHAKLNRKSENNFFPINKGLYFTLLFTGVNILW